VAGRVWHEWLGGHGMNGYVFSSCGIPAGEVDMGVGPDADSALPPVVSTVH